MNFAEACKALLEGKALRRPSWFEGISIKLLIQPRPNLSKSNNTFVLYGAENELHEPYVMNRDAMLADDWELVSNDIIDPFTNRPKKGE